MIASENLAYEFKKISKFIKPNSKFKYLVNEYLNKGAILMTKIINIGVLEIRLRKLKLFHILERLLVHVV